MLWGEAMEEVSLDVVHVVGCRPTQGGASLGGQHDEDAPLVARARNFRDESPLTHPADVMRESTFLPTEFVTELDDAASLIGLIRQGGEDEVVLVRETVLAETLPEAGLELQLHQREAFPCP